MSDLYWLTDEQIARVEPYFPKSHGKPRVDDRRGAVRLTLTSLHLRLLGARVQQGLDASDLL